MSEEIAGRAKCQTIENDKQRRKEYIKASTSGTIKDLIKIRLHMWDLKADYGRKALDNRFPMCQSEEVPQNISSNVQQKFLKRTRKVDQYITQEKNKLYQKNRRKEKTVEDRRRQISEKKKMLEKKVEELRDSKGAEKTEQNSIIYIYIILYIIYIIYIYIHIYIYIYIQQQQNYIITVLQYLTTQI